MHSVYIAGVRYPVDLFCYKCGCRMTFRTGRSAHVEGVAFTFSCHGQEKSINITDRDAEDGIDLDPGLIQAVIDSVRYND